MTTPPSTPNTKTIRVSHEAHKQLHDLAAKLNGTADDALRYLLGVSTVRVPVTDVQRERWTEAAQTAGVSLPQYVTMRVEAVLQFGADPAWLGMIYDRVNGLYTAIQDREQS